MLPHIIKEDGTISILVNGKMENIDTAHANYVKIQNAIKNGEWDNIPNLINVVKTVDDAINNSTAKNKIELKDGFIYYNNDKIDNSLTKRIIDMAAQDFDIGFMVTFLDNLLSNPSYRAVNELYDFLEVGNMPITENGTFLTYKKISKDWKDIYTGKFDNSIGSVCSMPRNMVDEDSSRTCSKGLHVCSYDYLPHFGVTSGSRVVICEVNPKDVVAIPQDYNNTKMRVSEYKVIAEVENYQKENLLAKNAVMFVNPESSESSESSQAPQDSTPQDSTPQYGISQDDTPRDDTSLSKVVGKTVQKYLDDGIASIYDVETALHAELLDYQVDEIIDNFEYYNSTKWLGKKIKKLIDAKELDIDTFMKNLIYAIENDERSTTIKTSTANELDAVEDTPPDMDTDEEEFNLCPRCNGSIVDNECIECGYYTTNS